MVNWPTFARLIDWITTSQAYRESASTHASKLGLEALHVLREELGNGEEGGNNRGPHIERWGGKQGKAHCAAFIYFGIAKACHRLARLRPFKRTNGARALFRRAVRSGMLVELLDVLPGDLVLFDRGHPDRKSDRWKAHIGIVYRVERSGGVVTSWYYIAANEGPFPAVVAEHDGTKRGRLIGFARLP